MAFASIHINVFYDNDLAWPRSSCTLVLMASSIRKSSSTQRAACRTIFKGRCGLPT